MNVIETDIPELVIIEPKLVGDQRGFFLETFQAERYRASGISRPFVQDNLSRSEFGVLRGLLDLQIGTQGKLVTVLGDVSSMLRSTSAWVAQPSVATSRSGFTEDNRRQFWVPGVLRTVCCSVELRIS
jgi:dTDP-4-dehydrorhamnose 3,5-epimerase